MLLLWRRERLVPHSHLDNLLVFVMYHELSQWYRERRRDPTAKPVTEVSDMTTTMVWTEITHCAKTRNGDMRNDAFLVGHT